METVVERPAALDVHKQQGDGLRARSGQVAPA